MTQRVPGEAGDVDDGVVVVEDLVGEIVVAEVLPDVLDRIELGRVRRGRVRIERLSGMVMAARWWYPAPSMTTRAWAPGATLRLISARWMSIASVLAWGRMTAAVAARSGQTAPKM